MLPSARALSFLDPGRQRVKASLSLCFTLKGRVFLGKVIASALLVAVVVAPAVDLLCAGVYAQNRQSTLPTGPGKQGEFVPGELLVRFRPGETLAGFK